MTSPSTFTFTSGKRKRDRFALAWEHPDGRGVRHSVPPSLVNFFGERHSQGRPAPLPGRAKHPRLPAAAPLPHQPLVHEAAHLEERAGVVEPVLPRDLVVLGHQVHDLVPARRRSGAGAGAGSRLRLPPGRRQRRARLAGAVALGGGGDGGGDGGGLEPLRHGSGRHDDGQNGWRHGVGAQ